LGQVSVALDEELHREVALKEIQDRHADHPDSRARFLLEAEITGGLEHPGIVPVYGLGSYPDGRPFYAMRFIRGDSLQNAIARYHQADRADRSSHERSLELRQLLGRFIDVCDAIAYAHSRGVLHRDLKPGNVMLGPYGETLVVDWGLAKPKGVRATDGNEPTAEGTLRPVLSDSAPPTQAGTALGTPAYMPPEQAAGRLDELGPASDVYSLGATLYCLLTGKAPFEGGEDVGEILRRVQAGNFPRPREVRRDVPAALEAVCLKAMALQPQERYAGPRALAADVERWLADEPVSAYREPWQMRARRWVGRHRTLVATTAATLLVATVSLSVATIFLQKANADKEAALHQAKEQAAIAQAVNEFLQKDLLGQADIGQQMVGPREQRDPDVKVRTLLDRAAQSIEGKFMEQPLTEAALRLTIGDAYRELGRYAESQQHVERSLQLRTAHLGADHPDTLVSKNGLAAVYYELGKYGLAEPLYQEVVQVRTAHLGANHPNTLNSKYNLAVLYLFQGEHGLAEPLFKEVLQAQMAHLGADHPDTLDTKYSLAMLYNEQGKYELAEPLYKEVLQEWAVKRGADHPHTLRGKNSLATLYHDQGKHDLAEPLYQEVLQAQIAKLGADHPHTLTTKDNLAGLYQAQGQYDLAERLYKEVLQAWTAKVGADHPDTLISKNNLATLYVRQSKYDPAEPLLKEVAQGLTAQLGADHPDTLSIKHNLAGLYFAQGKYGLAESLLKKVLPARTTKLGADHPQTLITMAALGFNLLRQKRYAEAEPILRDCLAIRDKKEADLWTTFDTRSILGEALAGQKKFAEAEPLLLQGYEGMKQREKGIPAHGKGHLHEGLERLVQLYDAWGKKDKADDYRKQLEAERAKSSPKKK
jgi:serine/threonine protein kinase/Tfp pilus assembly protein PilF